MECSVEGCERRRASRGLCQTHARRQCRGVPLDAPGNRRWTEAEDLQVLTLLALVRPGRKNVPPGAPAALAARLGRSVQSVRDRLHRLRRLQMG